MRVLYISTSELPSLKANSIQVMKMCQAMAQSGHAPVLLAPAHRDMDSTSEQKLWHHYGIHHPFPIRRLPLSKPLRGLDYVFRAALFARRARPELIYTRDLQTAALTACWGMPTVYEAHDIPRGRLGPTYFRLLLKAKGFRCLAVISQALRRLMLERRGCSRNETVVLVAPDGVDLERFKGLPTPQEARRRLGMDPERFTAGYTGHLYAGRGIELIFDLAHRCNQVSFQLIGGNPEEREKCRQKAKHRGLDNVTFLGFVPNSELALYQAASEVLLLPYQRRVAVSGGSDTAAIMSPMKMFEYMATGRLIISSDLPALCEVLNERNAVLCNPTDVVAWQQAIERAIVDSAWRESLGRQAHEDVKQYTWQRRVDMVLGNSTTGVS